MRITLDRLLQRYEWRQNELKSVCILLLFNWRKVHLDHFIGSGVCVSEAYAIGSVNRSLLETIFSFLVIVGPVIFRYPRITKTAPI
jgi:hypothetical protein